MANAAGFDLHKHLILARELQLGLFDAEARPLTREGGLFEGLWE
jgi:hypothetical protein